MDIAQALRRAVPFILLPVVLSGCATRRTVTETFVIRPPEFSGGCSMTWEAGDYWGLVAWALLSDTSSAAVLAMSAGYSPDSLPLPGAAVILPLPAGMEEALEQRMAAARLVRDATALRRDGLPGTLELLERAVSLDPGWSIPRTDIALIRLESGDREGAGAVLEPVAHKYTPALLLAMLDWEEGLTASALDRISEAMSEPDPPPETLAAAAVMYTVTGEGYLASLAWRRILENPDAPSHIRLTALRMLLGY
jgi:hypothetical protein